MNKQVIGEFVDDVAVVYEKNNGTIKKYLIDRNGEKIKLPDGSTFGDFSCGLASFKQNSKEGYINRKGEIVIEPKFTLCEDFSEGLAFVFYSGHNQLIDINGNGITEFEPDIITTGFYEGMARVGNLKERAHLIIDGFIDVHGDLVIPMIYEREIECPMDWIDSNDILSEGLVRVKKGKKLGFINKQGNVEIDFQYDSVTKFNDGLSAVAKNGKVGFIDKNNNEIIPLIFDKAAFYLNGFAFLYDRNNWLIMDPKSKKADVFHFEDVALINNGMIAVNKNFKWGVLDKELNLIFPIIADDPPYYNEGVFRYTQNGLWSIMNSAGNVISEDTIESNW